MSDLKYKLIEPDCVENYSDQSEDVERFEIFKENYVKNVLEKFSYIISEIEFSKDVQKTEFQPSLTLEDEFLSAEIEAFVAHNQSDWWYTEEKFLKNCRECYHNYSGHCAINDIDIDLIVDFSPCEDFRREN